MLYWFGIPASTIFTIIKILMSDSGVARANNVTVYLMIEYHPQRIVSVAGYDERRRLIQIGSFLDNEHYSNLESIIIQMNPK